MVWEVYALPDASTPQSPLACILSGTFLEIITNGSATPSSGRFLTWAPKTFRLHLC